MVSVLTRRTFRSRLDWDLAARSWCVASPFRPWPSRKGHWYRSYLCRSVLERSGLQQQQSTTGGANLCGSPV